MNLIQKAIKHAGGPSYIGEVAGVSRQAVWQWGKTGFPNTEWIRGGNGATNYSGLLVKEARRRGYKYSKQELLDVSLNLGD